MSNSLPCDAYTVELEYYAAGDEEGWCATVTGSDGSYKLLYGSYLSTLMKDVTTFIMSGEKAGG